jgi:hypothetical protein
LNDAEYTRIFDHHGDHLADFCEAQAGGDFFEHSVIHFVGDRSMDSKATVNFRGVKHQQRGGAASSRIVQSCLI